MWVWSTVFSTAVLLHCGPVLLGIRTRPQPWLLKPLKRCLGDWVASHQTRIAFASLKDDELADLISGRKETKTSKVRGAVVMPVSYI